MKRSNSMSSSRSQRKQRVWMSAWLVVALLLSGPRPGMAASAAALNADGAAALATLRENDPVARQLSSSANGILVFPDILKAGFMFGGQIGEGVLLERGKPVGYYNSVAASYGLQAGIQKFGYALFFMDEGSLADFQNSSGFEIGVGPSIVLVDSGFGKTLTTETIKSGIYAFIFDQKGVMAGIGLQGSKITRISK